MKHSLAVFMLIMAAALGGCARDTLFPSSGATVESGPPVAAPAPKVAKAPDMADFPFIAGGAVFAIGRAGAGAGTGTVATHRIPGFTAFTLIEPKTVARPGYGLYTYFALTGRDRNKEINVLKMILSGAEYHPASGSSASSVFNLLVLPVKDAELALHLASSTDSVADRSTRLYGVYDTNSSKLLEQMACSVGKQKCPTGSVVVITSDQPIQWNGGVPSIPDGAWVSYASCRCGTEEGIRGALLQVVGDATESDAIPERTPSFWEYASIIANGTFKLINKKS